MTYKILMMGPQGSGKGTQAELLSKHLNIPAFGMGQLLRDVVSSGSSLGQEIKRITDKGNLVSDPVAAEVLKNRLAEPDTTNGYILDGFPRNQSQYEIMEQVDEPTHVLVIEIPKEETLRRLSGRLTCLVCGRVYRAAEGHAAGESCLCGEGTLVQRDDDKPEAIMRRLEIYEQDTTPVIAQYEAKGLLHHVDGMGSVAEVQARIIASL
ncbi:nucleoside monophosphate kinase [Candidatus Uhrbacteria bacterium]|nr:nucleoside monophosphate kinase [Candidatus Uhrbacteria bacterium]